MSRLRIAAVLAAVTALTAGLAACGSSSKSAASDSSSSGGTPDLSSVTLRVGATGWNTSGAALEVAGLDKTPYKIDWSVFTGGNKQIEALQGGALDVGQASEIPPVFGAAAGTPKWKVVAVSNATTLLQEVVVGKNSSITDIASLKGKKVGYVQNTTAQYFLVKLLEQAGLKWSDIKPAPLSPQDGVAALRGGSIDALATYGNSVIAVHTAGGKTIGTGADILSGNFPWIASNAVIADPAKAAATADLLARINKAYAVIRGGKEQQFAAKTATATHEDVSLALSQLQAGEKQRPTTILPAATSQIASAQAVADVFTQVGALPKKIDVAAIWSTALNADLTAAIKSLGASS